MNELDPRLDFGKARVVPLYVEIFHGNTRRALGPALRRRVSRNPQ